MKKVKTISFFSLILSSLFLLPFAAQAESTKVSVSGSSTLAPLAAEIAKRLEESDSSLRVDVQTGGSSKGITDVIKGLSDVGMSSRALFPEEEAIVKSHTVALDGVAFVVNSKNPVKELSQAQLANIYSGKISNWKELGGQDLEITVIDRAKGRSEKELVKDYLGIKAAAYKPDVVAGENQQCVKLLEGNQGALVYLSIGTTEFEQKRSSKIRALPLSGVAATAENVKNGSFPIIRPLVLITKKELSPSSKEFVQFAVSSQVKDLVEGMAFVAPQ